LDYLGVFIDILLVLGKNPCSLAAKLCKVVKNWRFPVCTKLSKMTQLYILYSSTEPHYLIRTWRWKVSIKVGADLNWKCNNLQIIKLYLEYLLCFTIRTEYMAISRVHIFALLEGNIELQNLII